MGARNEKRHPAKEFKKYAKALQNMSPSNSLKTLLDKAVNHAVSKQQDVQGRMPPQKHDNFQLPSTKKQGEDQVSPKGQELQNNGEDQTPSDQIQGEDRFQPCR